MYLSGGIAAAGILRLLVPPEVELRLHVPDNRGVVDASPAGLARAAGTSLATYALASAMQSEEHNDRGRLAVGRAIWNAVAGRPDRIFPKLAPHGRFGAQFLNGYAATTKPPTARTLILAEAVLAGRVPDFVAGATQWDAPAVQDRGHALYLTDPVAYPEYRFSSENIADRRHLAGLREVHVDGVPATRFWTRARA